MNGGLVYIYTILFLKAALYFVVGIFIFNTLSLYLLNTSKYTKKFINFAFILGEFVGGFVGCIVGGCLCELILLRVLRFDTIVFLALIAFMLSFVLLVFNMLLFTIRYRVFEKSRYESLLDSHSKKVGLRKSFIFGVCFSFLLNCIWVIAFVIWLKMLT